MNEFLRRNADTIIRRASKPSPSTHHQQMVNGKSSNSQYPSHVPSIMDSTLAQLTDIIRHFLQRFDDYQQICRDAQYFADAYDQLESYLIRIRRGETITYSDRNNIRRLCKYTEKHAAVNPYFD